MSEGLTAVCLLLKLAAVETSDSKMNTLWNLIINSEKQIFVSEKFLTQASNEGNLMILLFSLFMFIVCL